MVVKTRPHPVKKRTQHWLKSPHKVSLPGLLTIPFILQVAAVVGLVGYLSYSNSQRSIEDLTAQLMESVGNRVEQRLTNYLDTAWLVNQLNSDAVRRGDFDFDLSQPNARRELYLWQQMQQFRNLTWISIGAETGDTVGSWRPSEKEDVQLTLTNASTQYFGNYYATNDQGQRTQRLKIEKPEFNPRTRPWYKQAIAAKRPVWTSIYSGFTPGTIFIAASQPLYSASNQLLGVSGIDLSLSGIQEFLIQTPISASGQVFLVERSGMLVASSSSERPFRLVGQDKTPQRVSVFESQVPLIRSTAEFLRERFGNFQAIRQPDRLQFVTQRDGHSEREFVQVLPFSMEGGLDWLIVIVVPESDVMANVNAGTQTTQLLCLVVLLTVIALNTLLSRWLAKPIVGLSQASQQIARGDFSQRVQGTSIMELSVLADSFAQMSQEIQQSRQQLEDYSRSLEQKVSDRTQELQQEVQRRAAAETALQSANQELQKIAYLDGLTQISNRRMFDERLSQEWRRAKREKSPLSLIMCDVDFFKQYNDTYGHQQGDECLRLVAQAIATAARRPFDLAARYGGEEFAILLPNTPLLGALEVAREIQTRIHVLQLPHQQSKVGLFVTMSFGVATISPSDGTEVGQLVAQADQLLYQAKQDGRDCIQV